MVEITSSKARSTLGTVKACQEMIQRSLQTPMVKFLMEHMEKSGCKVGDNFIRAVPCNKQMAGGFIRGKGIIVCSNHMRIQDEVTQVVIHELIHAYDDCRAANLDFRNCAHHVCSEIRANNLSGDCHFKRELLRNLGKIYRDIHAQTHANLSTEELFRSSMKIRGHGQECVKRRALKSMAANPFCSEKAAKKAMEAVWDICYNDAKPFKRVP